MDKGRAFVMEIRSAESAPWRTCGQPARRGELAGFFLTGPEFTTPLPAHKFTTARQARGLMPELCVLTHRSLTCPEFPSVESDTTAREVDHGDECGQ